MESLFRMKKVQIEMIRDRGYDIGDESFVLEMNFESFLGIYGKRAQIEGVDLRQTLTQTYTHKDGHSIIVFYAMPSKDTDKLSIDKIKLFLSRILDENHSKAILITPINLTTEEPLKEYKTFTYQIFFDNELKYNVTKHKLVPPHELLTPEEEASFLKEAKALKKNMPIIRKSDPPIKYYGWEAGRIVRIKRNLLFLDILSRNPICYRLIVDI